MRIYITSVKCEATSDHRLSLAIGLTLIADERMVGQSIASTIQRNGVIGTLSHRRLDRLKWP